MVKIPLCVFFVLLSLSIAYGAVSFSPIEKEKVYGKMVKFCTYNGIRLLPRSVIKNYDTCERCVCRRNGLDCATLNTAFTVNYPDDSKCVSVRIGCRNRWVRRNNNNRKCPKKLIPKEISMAGK